MENAVAAARAAGPVPNGATAMEEDEPPSKRGAQPLSPVDLAFPNASAECADFVARLLTCHVFGSF